MKKLASLRWLELSIACIGEIRLAHLHAKGCTKVMLESAASCLKLWQISTYGSVTLSLVWGRSYSDICNALLCFGVCNTCWRAWYVHFSSLFYIIIYLYSSIFFILWCNTYVILPYFACFAIIGDSSARARNQLEKYLSRYQTSEAPKIPEKFGG